MAYCFWLFFYIYIYKERIALIGCDMGIDTVPVVIVLRRLEGVWVLCKGCMLAINNRLMI